ncbi:hypothetical protein [Actinosynnema sp. ALI-1.44]|uniref:hypothetical protein n=1 Tax=Actinosynnema sp. ALI-1.44 TaxID=1933779 RepID=UPI00143D8154|nr:hypothetical protein [Actinosynnema sp. ALI-1.44]
MAYSGALLYDGERWTQWRTGQEPEVAEPWLLLAVHGSDHVEVRYRPHRSASGVVHLGRKPVGAIETDVAGEAAALADWWVAVHGDARRRREIEDVMTGYLTNRPARAGHDGDQVDEGDEFADVKASRLLVALGLPVPDRLVQ